MITNKPGRGTSKNELYKNHLVKMGAKKLVRDKMYEDQKDELNYVRANLSINHPDWGLHPHHHEKNKLSEKSS